MADYTYEQLRDMKVQQLREIAQGIQDDHLQGYSTLHKEQLLPRLCLALHIHADHAAHGAEKTRIKALIRQLKTKRQEAQQARDYDRLGAIRHQIHVQKRKLRNMVARGV